MAHGGCLLRPRWWHGPSVETGREETRVASRTTPEMLPRRSVDHIEAGKDRSWKKILLEASAPARSRGLLRSRADRVEIVYLRAAQAYMLISMPTGTSTIFGVFQVIQVSQVLCGKS